MYDPVSPQWEEGLEMTMTKKTWRSASLHNTTMPLKIVQRTIFNAIENCPKDYFSVVRNSSQLPRTCYFDEVDSLHNSNLDISEAIEGGPSAPFKRCAPPLQDNLEPDRPFVDHARRGQMQDSSSALECQLSVWRTERHS